MMRRLIHPFKKLEISKKKQFSFTNQSFICQPYFLSISCRSSILLSDIASVLSVALTIKSDQIKLPIDLETRIKSSQINGYLNHQSNRMLSGSESMIRDQPDISNLQWLTTSLTSPKPMENDQVVEAWNRHDYKSVINLCDDIIDHTMNESFDFPRTRSLHSIEWDRLERDGHDNAKLVEEKTKDWIIITYQNIKASALIKLAKYEEALQVTENTLSLSPDRDAYCIKGVALNWYSNVIKNEMGLKLNGKLNPSKLEIKNDTHANIEALRCFTRALELCPDGEMDLEAGLNQATMLFKVGKVEKAMEACQYFLKKTVNDFDLNQSMHSKYDPEISLLLISCLFVLQRYQEALDRAELIENKLEKGVHFWPEQKIGKFLEIQASCFLSVGNLDQAHICYEKIISIDPYSQFALNGKITTMLLKGNEIETRQWIEKQLSPESNVFKKMDPNERSKFKNMRSMLWSWMAQIELSKKPEGAMKAIECCDKSIELSPSIIAYVLKAITLFKRGYPYLAIETCNQAEINGIYHADLALTKSVAWEKLENMDRSLASIDDALSLDKNHIGSWIRKGQLMERRGRYEEAMESYRKGLDLEPTNTILITSKANCQRLMGMMQEAIETMRNGIELNPDILNEVKEKMEREGEEEKVTKCSMEEKSKSVSKMKSIGVRTLLEILKSQNNEAKDKMN